MGIFDYDDKELQERGRRRARESVRLHDYSDDEPEDE